MLYILDGRGEFIIENIIYPISQGKLFYIKPNQTHSLLAEHENTVKTRDIKFDIKDKKLEKKIKQFKNEILIEEEIIPKLFKKIRNEGLEKDNLYYELSVVYLMEILYLVCRKNKTSRTKKKSSEILEIIDHDENFNVTETFTNYIRHYYMEDLLLKNIAKNIGYNESYICQCLKKEFNCTPMNFLYKFRIKKAKELIVNSDYSLKEISLMVGFKTVHHFSRKFKEYEEMSPGQFRDKERKGIRKDVYFKDDFLNKDITLKLNSGQKK